MYLCLLVCDYLCPSVCYRAIQYRFPWQRMERPHWCFSSLTTSPGLKALLVPPVSTLRWFIRTLSVYVCCDTPADSLLAVISLLRRSRRRKTRRRENIKQMYSYLSKLGTLQSKEPKHSQTKLARPRTQTHRHTDTHTHTHTQHRHTHTDTHTQTHTHTHTHTHTIALACENVWHDHTSR